MRIFKDRKEFVSRVANLSNMDKYGGNLVARLRQDGVRRSGCTPDFKMTTFYVLDYSMTIFTGTRPTVPCPCSLGQQAQVEKMALVTNSNLSCRVLYSRHPDLFYGSTEIEVLRKKIKKAAKKKSSSSSNKKWCGSKTYQFV